MDPAGIPALIAAIAHLHGVRATHLETAHVIDTHEGATVFERDVEVFALDGHALATRCYAWTEASTGTKRRFYAVLRVPPVDSPLAAVRASLIADAQAIEKAKKRLS